MNNLLKSLLTTSCLAFSTITLADTIVPMYFTAENGNGELAGNITISETKYGLLFSPNIHGITSGTRGFHIHANANCDKNGMAAGSHYDPTNTGKHLGPYSDNGHLGDLPVLAINSDGTATTPVLAPKINHVSDITGHALMVHHAGDNYSDNPAPLGGGGGRMLCGLIK